MVGKEFYTNAGLNLYDYHARQYEPAIGRFTTIDRLSEKYYSISPYAYVANNPIKYIDPTGDSIVINYMGNVVYNNKEDDVYLLDGKTYFHIGNLSKTIDADRFLGNMLRANAASTKSMWSPISFYRAVKTGGRWDLKNLSNSIFKLGDSFTFDGKDMQAQDIGNLNFGVVAAAYGFSERIALQGAGVYQVLSGTSKSEWRTAETVSGYNYSITGAAHPTTVTVPAPPYGDDPRDQSWISSGYEYYNKYINPK